MHKKKRLLIIHPALAPYRVDFFNKLSENFDAIFYFYNRNVKDQKFNQVKLISLCKFQMNYLDKGIEFFGRTIRTGTISILKKEKPDIVLCSEYSFGTILTFLFKFIFFKKYKIFILSDDSISNSNDRGGLRKFFRDSISKRVEGVVFPSEEVCNWYRNEVSIKPKLLVLPIVHDDDVFRGELYNSLNKARHFAEKYNLNGKKIILFVGRLVEVKNIPLLIKAMSKIEDPDAFLVIVGAGSLLDQLKHLVNSLNISNRVLFTGRKEGTNLVSLYNIAQLFVLPSTYERFGAVVNEALLSGCEVLCSEKAGASSLINSSNGQLFNPFNEAELVDKLSKGLVNRKPLLIDNIELRKSKMPFKFIEKLEKLIDGFNSSIR